MIEAVFISDLHLHPANSAIANRFEDFLRWIPQTVKKLYILGDFLHVWVGDDALNAWSADVAFKVKALKNKGIEVYFMAGNRDFLLGKRFAEYADWTVLPDSTIIHCGNNAVLLSHGDRYCTRDKAHQFLRKITRNRLFCTIFVHMPLAFRSWLAAGLRNRSKQGKSVKALEIMDVVPENVLAHMQSKKVETLIHGHTHRPGMVEYQEQGSVYKRYVLSDWDDSPSILCYDESLGFYFAQIG